MRWLAILIVLAYRITLRRWWRRVCLYDESCSAFAIRTLRTRGVWAGYAVIRARVDSCRLPAGVCYVLSDDGEPTLIAATGRSGAPVPPHALAHCAAQARATHVATVGRREVPAS